MNNLQEKSKLQIIKAFVDEWKKCSIAETLLYINCSYNSFFSAVNFQNSQIVSSSDEINMDSKFDLIIGNLPVGMNNFEFKLPGSNFKIPQKWREIYLSIFSLSDNGTALYLMEPLGFNTIPGKKFEKELNQNGFFVRAIINAPEKVLQYETTITPIIVSISKIPPTKLFIAELLNEVQAEQVVDNYFSSIDGTDLKSGKFINLGSFQGFHRLKIKQQIERLETQYKNYTEFTLETLAIEISTVNYGEEFHEKNNSIYIPKVGKSPVVCKLSEAKLKHQNYFQVVLGELAFNEYVSAFFKSSLGQLILDSLTSRTYIPHLNKADLMNASVALPKFDEQKLIVNTIMSLTQLKSAIDKFDSELALNPKSSNSIQKQLTMMLDAIGKLTDADKVRGLVREGESKFTEFKETLSLDLRTQIRDKGVETAALKTVVAFLNTEGGVLLIGLSDHGEISGLNKEIEKFYPNLDRFLLHWKNLLKDRVGEEYYPFFETKVVNVDDKLVLWVECKESTIPCYLDQKDFYVRTNPASDKLEGPKLVAYVKIHFPQ